MAFSLTIDRNDFMGNLLEQSGGVWQGVFSFKNNSSNEIYPFSSSLETFLNNDGGIGAIKGKGDDKYNDFLNVLPSIKFRAYFPNTALNEIFSLMGKIGFEGKLSDFSWEKIEGFFKDASDILKGLSRPSASKNIASNIVEGVRGLGIDGSKFSIGDSSAAILKLPYALYYQLVSTRDAAVYEIPCQIPNGFFDSNGNYGWGDNSDLDIFNASGFFKRIASTFHFTMMPFFTPGNGGEGESINIKFDLINDTLERAKANYSFIQTLVLNNKWLQYGITQVPGCVYDVKIAGGQRFFMCTGDIKVSNKGILRTLGEKGSNVKPYGEETKIPDAYSLDITFKSLLPNNLNNYLFGIAKGNDLKVNPNGEDSIFGQIATKLVDALKGVGSSYRKEVNRRGSEASGSNTDTRDIGKFTLTNEQKEEEKKIRSSAENKAGEAGLKEFDRKKKELMASGLSEEEATQKAEASAKQVSKDTFDTEYIAGIQNSETMQDAVRQYVQTENNKLDTMKQDKLKLEEENSAIYRKIDLEQNSDIGNQILNESSSILDQNSLNIERLNSLISDSQKTIDDVQRRFLRKQP